MRPSSAARSPTDCCSGVDAHKARAMPGIRAVLTYADLRSVLACDRIPLALPVPALRFHVDPVRPRPAGGVLRRRTCCIGGGRQQATGRGCRRLGRARHASPARGARAARRPRAGRAQGAARLSRQSGRPLGGGIRRCRARIRRRSPPDVRAFSHPQGWRTFDRGARRARALRRNRRVAHGLGQHADAAQDQAGPGRGPGSVGRARSRHRARCRRRLRSQEPILSRRAGSPGGRVAAGPPDQMDRGSPRMLHRHQSRARAGLGDGGGGRPRRQAARDPRPSAPRPRRNHPVRPFAAAEFGHQFHRPICPAGVSARGLALPHQSGGGDLDARRRTHAGHLRDGAHARPHRRRAWPRPRRGAPAQSHHAAADALRHAGHRPATACR